MAQQALKDAENGNLVFHPESSVKDWNRWLGMFLCFASQPQNAAVDQRDHRVLTFVIYFQSLKMCREHSGLVHLEAAVVGPSDPSLQARLRTQ